MPESVLGLPVHPLVVHAAIILIPLASIFAVIIAASPDRRGRLGVLTWLLTSGALASAFVAQESGQFLERSLYPTVLPPAVSEHTGWGSSTVWYALALWLAVSALLLIELDRRRRSDFASPVLPSLVAVVTILVAMAATGQVLITGWTGSESKWSGVVSSISGHPHA